MIEVHEGPTMTTMADLIDDLFRSHRKPNGREYSHVEVCQALGGAIEPSHLGKLRNGTIQNPKRDTLIALCRFFQVSPTYFFPELAVCRREILSRSTNLCYTATYDSNLQNRRLRRDAR